MTIRSQPQPDVVVVGGGMLGASLAYRLARAGAAVTVVDSGEPGRGTSGSSFAWANANDKTPLDYFRLNKAGMEAHRRLRDDLLASGEDGGWLHEGGGLELAGEAGREALLSKAARLKSWGYRIEVLDPAAPAVHGLEPHLRPEGATEGAPDDALCATFCPDEAWVDAPRCVRAALGAAGTAGARVITNTPVAGLSLRGERVVGVELAGGESLSAAQVVLAAGRWTDGVARLAGVDVPLAPTCGLLAVTSPLGAGVSRVVHVPGMNFRPDPSGGLVVQSGPTDATVTAETVPDASLPGCATLLRGLQRYLPAAAGARIVAARVGVRPMPADGLTLAGTVDGRPGLALAVTHSGVTLGPLLGELLAQELRGGPPAALLEGFRPRRLVRLSRP